MNQLLSWRSDQASEDLSHGLLDLAEVALIAVAVGKNGRVSFRKEISKNGHVVLRGYPLGQFGIADIYAPAVLVPGLSGLGEFFGDDAVVAGGDGDADGGDGAAMERKDDVAGGDFAHVVVEGEVGAGLGELGGPHIAAADFLAVGFVLVDPPVAARRGCGH